MKTMLHIHHIHHIQRARNCPKKDQTLGRRNAGSKTIKFGRRSFHFKGWAEIEIPPFAIDISHVFCFFRMDPSRPCRKKLGIASAKRALRRAAEVLRTARLRRRRFSPGGFCPQAGDQNHPRRFAHGETNCLLQRGPPFQETTQILMMNIGMLGCLDGKKSHHVPL